MRNPIRRDLGIQLLSLYLLLMVPIILGALLLSQFANNKLTEDIIASDLTLAKSIAQETDYTLSNALEAVTKLSEYRSVINSDNEGMSELFTTVLNVRPDINLIYRLNSDGLMVFHYPTGPGSTLGEDFSFREYFQRARVTTRPLISKGRISPTTNQPVATAVMPLWDESANFLGLVGTNIKLESLSNLLSQITKEYSLDEELSVVVIDSSGKVIGQPNPDNLLRSLRDDLPDITDLVLLGNSGGVIKEMDDGSEYIYSYVPVSSSGWGVIIGRPTNIAFATPRLFFRLVLGSTIIFIVIGFLFWFMLSRQVIRPLERLAALSQTIGEQSEESDIDRLEFEDLSNRKDQIGHLIRSLTRMEAAIKARLNELSILLETSAAVVSTLDSQQVLDRILEQVERLMGIDKSAIVALDETHGIFRAQASKGLSKLYTDQILIDPTEPLSITLRAIRSGEPIQISDTELDASFAALRPRARSEGYRSVIAVPLQSQHAAPSALLIFKSEPHTFSNNEINLLTNFANHAAMAIENATLYARSDMRLQEQTRRLEALIQSLQDGLILENLSGNVIYANRRIRDLLIDYDNPIVGIPVSEVLSLISSQSSDPQETSERISEIISNRSDETVEITIPIDGRRICFRLQGFEVTDSGGIPIGYGQILRDITADSELDRLKSSLISTVAHELRTPLASIKGYATTLLADDVVWDRVSQQEFLKIISDESDRLSALVNDLLDLSRIESGSLIVNLTDNDLEDMIHRAALISHSNLDNRLVIEIPRTFPSLTVDRRRIEAVLRNLIENAAKYTQDDSKIRIEAIETDEEIVVKIIDQGPGIPLEDHKNIFNSFYRLENGLTRSATGAGLGLTICQGFINAHGGDIWVEPTNIGTTIAFSLPKSLVSAEELEF